jgi:hypothetical protein
LEGEHTRTLDLLTKFDHSEPAKNKLIQRVKQISTSLESLRGTSQALRVKLGKSPEQSPAKIAAQLRRLFGFRGLAVLSLPKEEQRELVALVVGRAGKESPEGIYVRNAAMVNGRPAARGWTRQAAPDWRYEQGKAACPTGPQREVSQTQIT